MTKRRRKINSSDKGKRGERKLAQWINHELTAWKYDPTSRRGQQHKGTEESPDVESPLPAHWEMKYGYNEPSDLDYEAAYTKLRGETDLSSAIPVLVHQKAEPGKRHIPLAFMRVEDAIRLLTMARWLNEQYDKGIVPWTERSDWENEG
jgi:hypothetical protein